MTTTSGAARRASAATSRTPPRSWASGTGRTRHARRSAGPPRCWRPTAPGRPLLDFRRGLMAEHVADSPDAARAAYRRAHAGATARGDTLLLSFTWRHLAGLALRDGEVAEARHGFAESLRIREELGFLIGTAPALAALADAVTGRRGGRSARRGGPAVPPHGRRSHLARRPSVHRPCRRPGGCARHGRGRRATVDPAQPCRLRRGWPEPDVARFRWPACPLGPLTRSPVTPRGRHMAGPRRMAESERPRGGSAGRVGASSGASTRQANPEVGLWRRRPGRQRRSRRPTGPENGRKSHCEAAAGYGCWSGTSRPHPLAQPFRRPHDSRSDQHRPLEPTGARRISRRFTTARIPAGTSPHCNPWTTRFRTTAKRCSVPWPRPCNGTGATARH